MRILCLHDANSSAPLLLNEVDEFAKRLHEKHSIELAFVNAPLIISNAADPTHHGTSNKPDLRETKSCTHANENEDDNECTKSNTISSQPHQDFKRTWYYDYHDTKKFTGLDASILNLSQIWNQSLYSNPFCGVMGIGQGAALAALMPLLEKEQHAFSDDNNDNYNDNDGLSEKAMMFEGIKFCIFFNGYDLLTYYDKKDCHNNSGDTVTNTDDLKEASNDTSNEMNQENHYYEEVKDIPSLHIISSSPTKSSSISNSSPVKARTEGNTTPTIVSDNQERSFDLYQHYGGNRNQSSNAQLHRVKNTKLSNNASIYNIIGKFLVHQKKTINAKKRLHKQTNQTVNNNGVIAENENEIEALIENAKMKLAVVEEKAHSLMASTIASNPPKSLMAIITPDVSNNDGSNGRGGTLVGGWAGHKDAFRSEGFKQSGGAPCPKEFVLKQEERLK